MTVVISLLHRLIILERTSSRGAVGSLNIHKFSVKWIFFFFLPLHPERPKQLKNLRKTRAISYVLTEKPHTNQKKKSMKEGRELKQINIT